jgi:signal transduction histidine kinase/CheY-like chemotaxis protein
MSNSQTEGKLARIADIAARHGFGEEDAKEIVSLIRQIERETNLLEFKYNRVMRDKHVVSSLLTKTSEDLKQALESEKKFVASISHEIRTPLNSIIGFVDLLKTTKLSGEQKAFLGNALASADHLMSLINDILDLSKIEAGQLEAHEEEIFIEDILMESISMVATRVKDGVRILYDVPELDYLLCGDPVRIKQIFVNLLANAVKFTEKGNIKLRLIGSESVDSRKMRMTWCVEDTGIGIPADRISTIFDSFKQGHDYGYGGTGLGLYLSRSIARLMGGDITVESKVTVGSKFYVHLILSRGRSKEQKFSFHQKRIMIVGDGKSSGYSLSAKFRRQGAVVIDREFEKPLDIAKYFASTDSPIDVLVMDLDVFGNRSLSLASLLRDAYPDLVIIGTTENRGQGQGEMIDRVIARPYTYYRLAEVVNNLLVRSRADVRKSTLSHMKVLLAEDVEVNALLAKSMFEKYFDIRLDLARDGVEALEKVMKNDYDLVFMDIQMPNMDGFAAAKAIREKGIAVPIAAMTADAFSDSVELARKAGMDDYITKPIKEESIRKVLERFSRNT